MANRRSPPSSAAATRAVGYLRRSTDRQEQSIPDQKKAVEAYAEERGLTLVQFYVDDAISGTSTLARKAFQEMIAEAQNPRRGWSAIVVYDIKRFGRIDNDEAGYYRHLLRTRGVEIHYVSEGFTGEGTDDLLRPVKQWQARQESKDLSKATIRGQLSRAEAGLWMGGTPPVGYDLKYENDRGEFLHILRHVPNGTKQLLDAQGKLIRLLGKGERLTISKRDRCRLVPGNPERVEIVRRIFRMYAEEGRGFRAIADALNREGTPPVRGPGWARIYTGTWAASTVRAILMNRAYVGDMIWNRRTDARFHKVNGGRAVERADPHGGRLVPNDESEWIVVKDCHPVLISKRLFERARKRREERSRSRGKGAGRPVGGWKGVRSRFVLSGLVVCDACGCRYQGRTVAKGIKKKDGERVRTYYYACGARIRNGKSVCQVPQIPQETLERTVIETVLDHYHIYEGKEGRTRLSAEVRRQMGENSISLAEARHRLLEKQSHIDNKIAKLLDNLTSENREFVDDRLRQLKKDRDDVRVGLDQLDSLAEAKAAVRETIQEAGEFLGGLEPVLMKEIPEKIRIALRRCVEKVLVPARGTKLTLSIYTVPTTESESTEIHALLPANARRSTRGRSRSKYKDCSKARFR